MNPRSRLLTAVVVACVLAAAAGFFLVMQKSPEAARLRLLVDVLLLAALAGTAFVVTRNPLERQEELLDAMRALSRGARDRRLDYERFGDLEDVARAYNELAAALTEHEDPNLGPIKTKRRQERPAWMDPDASDHPQLGEIRVISKKQKAAEAMQAEERAARAKELAQAPEPVVEHRSKTKARAKKREREAAQEKVAAEAGDVDDSLPSRPEESKAVESSDQPTVAPTRAREKVAEPVKRPPLEDAKTAPPAARATSPREESDAAASAQASGDDDELASAAPDNDTAIDELLRLSKEGEPSQDAEPEEAPQAASADSTADADEDEDEDEDEEPIDPSREKTLPPFDMSALFQEFVEAKRAHDESTDDLEYDVFAETLVDEMSRLLEAHACRAVRFEVRVQDGEVSLLPRLIR